MKAVQIERFGAPEVLEVAEVSSPEPQGDEVLERFANRVVLCKGVAHGNLLEGPKDQGSCRGGEGHPQEGGGRDLLYLPYDPKTLDQAQEGGQGSFARALHWKETAHPR
jgi:hypothetical protein